MFWLATNVVTFVIHSGVVYATINKLKMCNYGNILVYSFRLMFESSLGHHSYACIHTTILDFDTVTTR
jgi:hypothetical protein